jgi:hypothetical protein
MRTPRHHRGQQWGRVEERLSDVRFPNAIRWRSVDVDDALKADLRILECLTKASIT